MAQVQFCYSFTLTFKVKIKFMEIVLDFRIFVNGERLLLPSDRKSGICHRPHFKVTNSEMWISGKTVRFSKYDFYTGWYSSLNGNFATWLRFKVKHFLVIHLLKKCEGRVCPRHICLDSHGLPVLLLLNVYNRANSRRLRSKLRYPTKLYA